MTATHHQPTREDIAALAALLREYHTLVAQGLRPMSVADEAAWEERLTNLQARVAERGDVWAAVEDAENAISGAWLWRKGRESREEGK